MMAEKSDNEIHALAAMWAARMDRGALSALEQVFLDNWLAADTRRLGALARAQASLVPFAEVREAPAEVAGPVTGPVTEPVTGPAESSDVAPAPMAAPAQRIGRRRLLQMAAAATALVAGGGLYALLPRQQIETYRTDSGEVRMLPLADGSVVTLNTDSEIAVDFAPERRTIHLVRGEALFDVAKDRSRPFRVRTGVADVTAVGTSFTVRRAVGADGAPLEHGAVHVAVRTGVVEVAAPVGQRQSQLLGANMQAVAGEEGRVVARPMSSDELNRNLAWREGKIAFSDTSLREAVAEFNRYNRLKLAIGDESIAGRTMTGLFSATNPKGFAAAVALSLEVGFYETADGIVFTGLLPPPEPAVLADFD